MTSITQSWALPRRGQPLIRPGMMFHFQSDITAWTIIAVYRATLYAGGEGWYSVILSSNGQLLTWPGSLGPIVRIDSNEF